MGCDIHLRLERRLKEDKKVIILPKEKDENGNCNGDYIEWVALLNTMKGYELSGEYECRAVFWFDN